MKKRRIDFGLIFIGTFFTLSLVIVILFIGSAVVESTSYEVIDEKIATAVVTNTDYSTYYVKNSGTKTKYIVAVRGDDFSEVFTVDSKTYAKYTVGDTVTIKCTISNTKIKGTRTDYELQ